MLPEAHTTHTVNRLKADGGPQRNQMLYDGVVPPFCGCISAHVPNLTHNKMARKIYNVNVLFDTIRSRVGSTCFLNHNQESQKMSPEFIRTTNASFRPKLDSMLFWGNLYSNECRTSNGKVFNQ